MEETQLHRWIDIPPSSTQSDQLVACPAGYLIDDYQFRLAGARPLRVDLRSGQVRLPTGLSDARIPGGSATVLGLTLDPRRSLASISFQALAQDVVIRTLATTLIRQGMSGAAIGRMLENGKGPQAIVTLQRAHGF
jgi:predicted transcriptional regulator